MELTEYTYDVHRIETIKAGTMKKICGKRG
jgi:hypothetical protein